MITVRYKPNFLRQYRKLPPELQAEVRESVERFREDPQCPSLRVHKLHGRLRGSLSFSVNYRYRVVFDWEKKNRIAVLLEIGDHDVYR